LAKISVHPLTKQQPNNPAQVSKQRPQKHNGERCLPLGAATSYLQSCTSGLLVYVFPRGMSSNSANLLLQRFSILPRVTAITAAFTSHYTCRKSHHLYVTNCSVIFVIICRFPPHTASTPHRFLMIPYAEVNALVENPFCPN
jgi:hypothetical protein